MNLIKAYRSTKLTTRIIIFSAFIILLTAISWVNNANVLLYTGVAFVVGISIEVLLKYSRKTVIVLLWVLNLFLLGFFVYTIFNIYIGVSTYEDAILNAGLVGIAGLISSILGHVLVHNLPVGSQWSNLLIIFPLFFVSIAVMIMWVPSAPMWVVSFVSVLVVALYPLLLTGVKTLIKKRQKTKVEQKYPRNKNVTMLKNTVEETFSSFTDISNENDVKTFYNEKAVILVAPLSGESRSVLIEKNTLSVDDEDLTWVLEDVMLKAKNFSRLNRVNQRNITPIIVVHNTNLQNSITPIKVRKRSNPDKLLGTVLLVKNQKLNALIRTLNENKQLTAREIKKLELIAQQS